MERIFLGIKGHVVCLDKQTGEEQWRRKIKIDWGKPTIVVFSEQLFIYLAGVLICMRPSDGEILWENHLKGLGTGTCTIAIDAKTSGNPLSGSGTSVTSEIVETVVDLSM